MLHRVAKKLEYLCNCKSKISNVSNKWKDHHANCCFDWLIAEHKSVSPWTEAIFILSGKYKRFTFVHPVHHCNSGPWAIVTDLQ